MLLRVMLGRAVQRPAGNERQQHRQRNQRVGGYRTIAMTAVNGQRGTNGKDSSEAGTTPRASQAACKCPDLSGE